MAHEEFQECIVACQECATACSHCALECLNESNVQDLTRCIQLNLECAAVCRSSAELMSLGSTFSEQICRMCEEICNRCAEECEKHEHMNHCAECAEECRDCAETCSRMVAAHAH